MKKFFCLLILSASLPALAVPEPVDELGSTLYLLAGDVSSGGDVMPGAEEPNMVEIITNRISSHALLSCNVSLGANAPFAAIEVSKSFSDWEDRGALRLVKPGEAGGAVTVFLETYRGSTQIDPATNQVSLKYVADSINSKGVVLNTLILQVEAVPKNGNLEIIEVDYIYTSAKGSSVFGNSSDGKTQCNWGALKTGWD